MPPPRLAILEGMKLRPKRRLIGFVETTDQQFDRRRNINGTDRATAFRAERAARHLRRAEGRGCAARSIPVDTAAWKLDPRRRQRADMLLALPAGACMRIVGRPDRLIANPAAEAPAAIDNFCRRLLPVSSAIPGRGFAMARGRDRFRCRSCTPRWSKRQPGIRQARA